MGNPFRTAPCRPPPARRLSGVGRRGGGRGWTVGRSTSPVRGSFEAKASEVRARIKLYTKGFNQAYSAGMGEDMYGRLLTEAPGERGAKNRYISQEWHPFLQFPSVSQAIQEKQLRTQRQVGGHRSGCARSCRRAVSGGWG
jgi:hypothetical protein